MIFGEYENFKNIFEKKVQKFFKNVKLMKAFRKSF